MKLVLGATALVACVLASSVAVASKGSTVKEALEVVGEGVGENLPLIFRASSRAMVRDRDDCDAQYDPEVSEKTKEAFVYECAVLRCASEGAADKPEGEIADIVATCSDEFKTVGYRPVRLALIAALVLLIGIGVWWRVQSSRSNA